MLTVQETRWSLTAFKIFSILNIFPIQVDVKTGKIARQSNKVKIFIWKFLFGVGVSHWLYIFGRLVQSTVMEPEKYFRWEHFVFHFGLTCFYAAFYFTGFCLFVGNGDENVMIFNQVFEEREDPVQKMIDRQLRQLRNKSGNGNGRRGNKTSRRSAREPREEIEMEVMETQSNFASEVCPPPRPLLTWPPQYSLDELLAKLHPFLMMFTTFCIILIFVVDPSRPQLLYSVLPPEWQNVRSFLILLTVETICLAVVCFTSSFAVVTQVLFFSKVQLEFQRMALQLRNLQEKFQNGPLGDRDLRREIWMLRQILAEMRELVVLIELFNRCFPFCIFAWKICSMSMTIALYFFVIRHFQDFPVLGLVSGYGAIAMTVVYTIMYEHAFSIPGKLDGLKNEFLLTAQKTTSSSAQNSNANANFNGNKMLWAGMKREIKRVRGVGIKVGNFNKMERESTPIFIDFVVKQVLSLLVTFSQ